MTNAEKFKSTEDRYVEFKKFCHKYACGNCPLNEDGIVEAKCGFKWLYLEYKEELKPCPFCGGTKTTRIEKDKSGYFRVECQNLKCEMNPKTPWCNIVESAIGVWNRRAK